MRKAQGYAVINDPDEGLTEMDTFTCAHCNCVTHVLPGQKPEDLGGLCMHCMGLVCNNCVGGACTPFLEKLAQEEQRYLALKSYGLV